VEFLPSVRLRLVGGSAVDEGRDARFECSVKAHPPLLEHPRWHWEGRPLCGRWATPCRKQRLPSRTHASRSASVPERTLLLAWRGNSRGKALSAPLNLQVRYAPRCAPNQRHEYQAALHQAVLVRCRVEAEPAAPTLFGWTFAGGPTRTGTHVARPHSLSRWTREPHTVTTGVLPNYVPRSELDYGTLACLASNPVGVAATPLLLLGARAGAEVQCSPSGSSARLHHGVAARRRRLPTRPAERPARSAPGVSEISAARNSGSFGFLRKVDLGHFVHF
ncbi:hypothetical protein MTO96_037224, partial [Rhipicephalus appendiculatus]